MKVVLGQWRKRTHTVNYPKGSYEKEALYLSRKAIWSPVEVPGRQTVLIKNNFFFNWRIIALQCCVGFCHTTV